jgi:prophage regulatory protein
MTTSLLRLPEVKNRTGLSRSTIYLKISLGEFPQNIKLGARCVGWIESDIESWIGQRVAESQRKAS